MGHALRSRPHADKLSNLYRHSSHDIQVCTQHQSDAHARFKFASAPPHVMSDSPAKSPKQLTHQMVPEAVPSTASLRCRPPWSEVIGPSSSATISSRHSVPGACTLHNCGLAACEFSDRGWHACEFPDQYCTGDRNVDCCWTKHQQIGLWIVHWHAAALGKQCADCDNRSKLRAPLVWRQLLNV